MNLYHEFSAPIVDNEKREVTLPFSLKFQLHYCFTKTWPWAKPWLIHWITYEPAGNAEVSNVYISIPD